MRAITIILGFLLVGLGAYGWGVTGKTHPTALIPAWFGIAFVLLGLLARSEKFYKHAMHLAAMLSLLGCVIPLVHLLVGKRPSPTSTQMQEAMAALCGLFLILCVRSFIAAAKRRRAAARV